jgi:nucleotide-binding universal stress UspA family protein
MAIKTILVHLADDQDCPTRLATAVRLAKRHGAHLVALYITRPLDLPIEVAGRAASLPFLEERAAKAEAVAAAVEAEFRGACERQNLTYDWIMQESDHLDALSQHAHAADLIVVSRGPDEHFEDRFRLRLAEELVMTTGLPILALPPGLPAVEIGRRVLVGWKPTREAVRALRDARPILARAEAVFLTTVRPTSEDAVATLEIQQYLERHGIPIQTLDVDEAAGGIGPTLLATAETHACDLLVTGAYGHNRLREMILGGVTRQLVRQSRLPLLLSH